MAAAEVIDVSETLPAVRENRSDVELGTLHASNPTALVEQASALATTLAAVISKQKLYSRIQGRDHVMVEGWTTLATMLGCVPREVSNERQSDGGYVATVELVRMRDGAVLSRATSECGMDESTWANRASYARRSMAATRATGKACRLAFSWIMALAGYEVTPAEEIPEEAPRRESPRPVQAAPPARDGGQKLASEKQTKMLWAKLMAKADALGITHDDAGAKFKDACAEMGFQSRTEITAGAVDNLVRWIDGLTLASFGAAEPPADADPVF